MAPSTIPHVDAVLATHAHTDHLDPGTLPALLDANPRTTLVAPAPAEGLALARAGVGAGRFRGLDAGDRLALTPGLEVLPVRAAHETLETDGSDVTVSSGSLSGSAVDGAPLGRHRSLRRAGGGDAGLKVDVALLPVNGRDAARRANSVPDNTTAGEVVALAREAAIPAVVACHFGFSRSTPCPSPRSRLLPPGPRTFTSFPAAWASLDPEGRLR